MDLLGVISGQDGPVVVHNNQEDHKTNIKICEQCPRFNYRRSETVWECFPVKFGNIISMNFTKKPPKNCNFELEHTILKKGNHG